MKNKIEGRVFMKFFILCSFIWMSFSTMAVTLHHSEIPQEDQQYLNVDMSTIDNDIPFEFYTAYYKHRIHYGCNSRGEYIGRCFEYCRPPNPQDQQVSVICDLDNYLIRVDDGDYIWSEVVPNRHIGIGTSPEEAEENARNAPPEPGYTPLTPGKAARMLRAKHSENRLRIIHIKWDNRSYCTPARVCIKVDYSLR